MLHGFLDLSLWGIVAYTLIATHLTIIGVTVYLHRHQTHRALELHPVVSHFLRFCLWIGTGMVTKEWVAIHRKHHAAAETEEDPHSPVVHGINKVLWGGVFLYRKTALDPKVTQDYGHGTPDDWIERNVYAARYQYFGVIAMLLIDVLLLGVIAGPIVWLIQMAWIPFWAAGVINGVGHWGGYRNFASPDASTNIIPLGIIIGGEELHNNHHAFATSAKFSSKWWEFDIGWLYICTLAFFKLATVKKVAPRPIVDTNKHSIDLETLTAITAHRFQILSSYGKEVVTPVYRSAMNQAAATGQRIFHGKWRRLLMKDEVLMDDKAKLELQTVLKHSGTLSVVYEYKQKLQEIWRRTTQNQEQLLHALQEWCKQAEATGIKALQDFAITLRYYRTTA